jgi:hypothetical protein
VYLNSKIGNDGNKVKCEKWKATENLKLLVLLLFLLNLKVRFSDMRDTCQFLYQRSSQSSHLDVVT